MARPSRVQQALLILEQVALRTIMDFDPQSVSNTFHAIAKAHYLPSDPSVLAALEGRAKAVAPWMT